LLLLIKRLKEMVLITISRLVVGYCLKIMMSNESSWKEWCLFWVKFIFIVHRIIQALFIINVDYYCLVIYKIIVNTHSLIVRLCQSKYFSVYFLHKFCLYLLEKGFTNWHCAFVAGNGQISYIIRMTSGNSSSNTIF